MRITLVHKAKTIQTIEHINQESLKVPNFG